MDIARAQEQMRHAYFGGAPGMLVSAIVWGAAAGVNASGHFTNAVWTLFIGGVMIHPLGLLLAKALGRPGSAKGNPMERLAFECTLTMIAALLPAWMISGLVAAWFFPTMLLIVGGRYIVFATVYGLRLYWAIGGVLVGAAWLAVTSPVPSAAVFAGSAIEALFAIVLFARSRGQAAPIPA